MNMSKFTFFSMMIISSMIVINSNNWLSMWMGIEINLMMFIPLIASYNNKKSSQSMMIYFLIQSIGSIIMLFSILMSLFMKVSPTFMEEAYKIMLNISLLLKMGAAPFHNWLPEMMNNMNWNKMLILMTWQKLAPLHMLSNMKLTLVFYISVILSSIIGAIGGVNSTSLRKIMAYSSINHLSWMLFLMMSQAQWWKYLMIYSIMIMMLTTFMNKYNAYNINQLMNKMPTMLEKYTYTSLMLSLGGLPPFIGFLPKWIAIQSNTQSTLMLIVMIMMSMITLFYYMRLISSMMLIYSSSNKWFKNQQSYNLIMYINFMLPLMYIINFL